MTATPAPLDRRAELTAVLAGRPYDMTAGLALIDWLESCRLCSHAQAVAYAEAVAMCHGMRPCRVEKFEDHARRYRVLMLGEVGVWWVHVRPGAVEVECSGEPLRRPCPYCADPRYLRAAQFSAPVLVLGAEPDDWRPAIAVFTDTGWQSFAARQVEHGPDRGRVCNVWRRAGPGGTMLLQLDPDPAAGVGPLARELLAVLTPRKGGAA